MKFLGVVVLVFATPFILFAALPLLPELIPLAIIMLLIGGAGAAFKRSF